MWIPELDSCYGQALERKNDPARLMEYLVGEERALKSKCREIAWQWEVKEQKYLSAEVWIP